MFIHFFSPKVVPFMRQYNDNIIRRTRSAFWITKAADSCTLGLCNNSNFSTATVVSRTCLNVTFIHTLPVQLFS